MITSHELAYACATDLANQRMRKDGRQKWSVEDYNAAVAEYHRVNPCPADIPCEICDRSEPCKLP